MSQGGAEVGIIDPQSEQLVEVKSVIRTIGLKMSVPLYMAFWFADLLFAPNQKWEFLLLRMTIIPSTVATYYFINRSTTLRAAQFTALFFVAANAIPITIMTWLTGGPTSSYYAGLNIVAAAGISFIPWTRPFLIAVIATVFSPFYLACALNANFIQGLQTLAVNSFFIIGTIVISVVIRLFQDRLRTDEFQSRVALLNEVQNRGQIIKEKTNEALQLGSLSKQFSPQVVDAIQKKRIAIGKSVKRSNICVVFIDIVNSTERVTRLDKDDIDIVITQFMEDAMKILLKYDITIDKFLGDGILAFANEPIQYVDYRERVVRAALEIRQRIILNSSKYEDHWLNDFQIRMGIASGYANVGFYGSDRYFKTFTAIGPVVNLASRLCSSAEPMQILASNEVARDLEGKGFALNFIGKKSLKGFENDIIKVFEVASDQVLNTDTDEVAECPHCQTVLHLDEGHDGIYVFKCRSCDCIAEGLPTKKHSHAA